MNTRSYSTVSAKKEEVQRSWFVVDAENQVLGRMCSKIATVLRGKHRPDFTPHVDTGDFIIVVNCDKVRLTGKKWDQKEYLTYSHWPGGQKSAIAANVRDKDATYIIMEAVKGMIPKTKLGRAMLKKLFVYEGAEHPHSAQKPEPLK